MPLSAAVHDLPHCGRGQRGIDFFFKSSPVLTSPVTQEKRDILGYFKRVEITKDQENQTYKSSLSNNTGDPDCAIISSEEEEIKPGKNEQIISKENDSVLSENCDKDVNKKERTQPASRTKETIMDSIDLTCETAHSGKTRLSAKGQNVNVCRSSGKLLEDPSDRGKSDDTKDEKPFPVVSGDILSDCEEGIIMNESDPHGSRSSELKSKECLEMKSNVSRRDKGEVKNPSLPSNSTESKKNAFTFMMANRARLTDAGKSSAEEENSNSQESGDDCVVVINSPSQNCETAAKSTESINLAASKKLQEVKSEKEKEHEDKTTDLNSSLQDFDLTPYEKPKRKRIKKPRNTKKEITDMKSYLEVAAPSDPPNHGSEERMSDYISFTDYMKGACSVAKESVIEENNVKDTDDVVKSNECISKCKINGPQLQQTLKNYPNCTKDDREHPDEVPKVNVNSLIECDEEVKERKLLCSFEKSEEKQAIQINHKDTEAMSQSKQMTTKMKRKRTRKKILVSSDSEEDFMVSKFVGVSKKKKEDPKICDKPSMVSNTARISDFFNKVNPKEIDEDENKVVFTVQADVHAPLDGNKKTERKLSSPAHTQASGESDGSCITTKEAASSTCSMKKNTKRYKKTTRNDINLDELNKIELLEQIPPSKPLSKKVLNKVCVEGKGSEVEKMNNETNTEFFNAVKAKNKVTLASKKGKFTKRGSSITKRVSVKNVTGAGKRLLRRKKFHSPSSGEESSDELFLRKKKREPPKSDKDITLTSASTSGSSGVSAEDAEEKSTSTLQSSPEASEDDKENVAHYTSQLVTQPGKLSLRIRRVHIPQETLRKEKLKQGKANKSTGQLDKVKVSRRSLKKRRLRTTLKQKSPKDVADKDSVNSDGTPLVEHDLIALDDDGDADYCAGKQIPKKTTRRRKITQTLLKPLTPKSTPKGRLQKKGLAVGRDSPRKSESELQSGMQRRTPRRAAATTKKYTEEATIDEEEDKPKKPDKNQKKLVTNKAMRLAPIFCKKPSSPCVELLKVVPLSPTKLKARQEFLNSSVSDDVKKQLAAEKSGEDEALAWPPFPEVSHVQQRKEEAGLWNLKDPEIPLKKDPFYSPCLENLTFTQNQTVFRREDIPHKKPSYHVPCLELGDIVFSLNCMKSKYPDFPVYEIFKAYYELKKEAVEAYQKEIQKEQVVVHLDHADDDDDEEEGNAVKRRKRKRKNKLSTLGRSKRRKLGSGKETVEDTSLNQKHVQSVWNERTPHMWTQIFMPKNSKQVIGNTENVKKLKLWLQEWKNKPQIKPKKRKKKASKRDDFVVSDDSTFGNDEEEVVSTYLLSGPPGIGKTAAVYALASELGYKVLEVNASSRRQGRQVMSQLAEATQSHSVSNTSAISHSSNAFSALFAARTSSSITKKEDSQTGDASTHDKDSSKMKGVSLVLFEDIDIVFEEWDEGFMSTVNNLMSTTKRPIILTATHISPLILSQIKESFEIMEFVFPPQKLIAQHLQLAALANGRHVCLQDVEYLVHHNKGDIRKSMLDLQLLSQSGSNHDICDCAVSESALDEHTEDSWKEIFPEAKTLIHKKPNQIEFYKVGLWSRLDAKTYFNIIDPKSYSEYLSDKEGICWKGIGSNINSILPFLVIEREKPLQRYPLQSDDPLLKRSSLWQYESLMCTDDAEEKKAEPVFEQSERKLKPNDPPEVQKASQSCVESLANMYDSLAQLDLLSSSQITTHEADIKDVGWWVKQPTAGLSDNPSPSHPHWTPHSNEGIIQELAQKVVTCCVQEVASALEGVNAKDWPQLCLLGDGKNETQSHVLAHSSDYESEQAEKRSVMSRICDYLPAVNQVSRSAALDYLPTLRSLAREDELGAALGRGRRGRRFLSHFLQLGWSVSPEDRISLANSLLT